MTSETKRLQQALTMLTKYLPDNIEYQLEGTVSIPIRELKAARDVASGVRQ